MSMLLGSLVMYGVPLTRVQAMEEVLFGIKHGRGAKNHGM